VMKDLNVYPENMSRNLELTRGLVFSQKVLLALINTGLSREEAYGIVQSNAMKVWQEGEDFLTLLKSDNRVNERLDASRIDSLFDYDYYIKYVDTIFQRLGLVELKDMPSQMEN
ncbi:adenylosuccinate lyase, partial [bacterium]|nr:adenylosuccinate lyase [bacterium]